MLSRLRSKSEERLLDQKGLTVITAICRFVAIEPKGEVQAVLAKARRYGEDISLTLRGKSGGAQHMKLRFAEDIVEKPLRSHRNVCDIFIFAFDRYCMPFLKGMALVHRQKCANRQIRLTWVSSRHT